MRRPCSQNIHTTPSLPHNGLLRDFCGDFSAFCCCSCITLTLRDVEAQMNLSHRQQHHHANQPRWIDRLRVFSLSLSHLSFSRFSLSHLLTLPFSDTLSNGPCHAYAQSKHRSREKKRPRMPRCGVSTGNDICRFGPFLRSGHSKSFTSFNCEDREVNLCSTKRWRLSICNEFFQSQSARSCDVCASAGTHTARTLHCIKSLETPVCQTF